MRAVQRQEDSNEEQRQAVAEALHRAHIKAEHEERKEGRTILALRTLLLIVTLWGLWATGQILHLF